jgi:7-cyano-7-deazaguanine synthase in queuosine biosynthesis
MNIEIVMGGAKRHEDGLAAISVRVPDLGTEFDLDFPFKKLYEHCGVPDYITLDLLIMSGLCYVIDKVVPRSVADDRWTRELEVTFPVSAPERWEAVARDFEAALSFLTGDVWQVSFRKHEAAFFWHVPVRRRRRRRLLIPRMGPATSVCLFSGGLDSLVGAVDLLAGNEEERVLLVGHYDVAGPRSQQNDLFAEIGRRYPRRAELLQTRVSHKPDAAPETSLRSRSLVFMALGIYAARKFGNEVPLYAPENGPIAINVPLTPSRAGSCSTRTMHPFFLARLGAVLAGLGFGNRIINPLRLKTKGECVTECLNRPLLEALCETSVSCSHGTRRQNWVRRDANNCGYCVPCMYRRAALHRAGLDDGQKYGIDVCAGELAIDDEGETADDLRAMLDWLRARKGMREIVSEIRAVAPVEGAEECAETVVRSADEVRAWVRDKGVSAVRSAAGIVKVPQAS